jgi:hypothetical protein
MRYLYIIMTILLLSSNGYAQTSPNVPQSTTPAVSPNTVPVQPNLQQTPSTSKIPEQYQLTTTERDAYKQLVDAYQKSVFLTIASPAFDSQNVCKNFNV